VRRLTRLSRAFLRHSIYKKRMKFVNLDSRINAPTDSTLNDKKLAYLDEFMDNTFIADYFHSYESMIKSQDSISSSHSHLHSHSL
jgi:hypothetical protein